MRLFLYWQLYQNYVANWKALDNSSKHTFPSFNLWLILEGKFLQWKRKQNKNLDVEQNNFNIVVVITTKIVKIIAYLIKLITIFVIGTYHGFQFNLEIISLSSLKNGKNNHSFFPFSMSKLFCSFASFRSKGCWNIFSRLGKSNSYLNEMVLPTNRPFLDP